MAIRRDGPTHDVGGSSPLRLTSACGGRTVTCSRTGRPDRLGPADTTVRHRTPAAPAIAPGVGEMNVPATQAWTPTGMTVARGETLTFTATRRSAATAARRIRHRRARRLERSQQRQPAAERRRGRADWTHRQRARRSRNRARRIQVPMPAGGSSSSVSTTTTVADNQGAVPASKIERSGRRR